MQTYRTYKMYHPTVRGLSICKRPFKAPLTIRHFRPVRMQLHPYVPRNVYARNAIAQNACCNRNVKKRVRDRMLRLSRGKHVLVTNTSRGLSRQGDTIAYSRNHPTVSGSTASELSIRSAQRNEVDSQCLSKGIREGDKRRSRK